MLLKTVVECADFVAHSFIIKNVRKNLWRMAIHPNIECWVSSPYNVMNKKYLKKIGLILMGIILTLVILELGLRIGGFIISSVKDSKNRFDLNNESYTILCLGDSVTADLYNGQGTWPKELEIILNKGSSNKTFRVINEGVPGATSNFILFILNNKLEEYKPNMVIVMAGSEDKHYLNSKMGFLNKLRVYKLFRLLISNINYKVKKDLRSNFSWAEDTNYRYEESLKGVIKHDPNNDEAYSSLGLYYKDLGRTEEAEEMFRKAIEINPKNYDAYVRLGRYYKDIGEFDKAEGMFRKAIEINPKNYDAYIELAYFYETLDMMDKAREVYQQAIEVNPENYDTLIALAVYHIEQNESKEAEEILKRAIEVKENDYDAYVEGGELYTRLGKYKEAEEILKRAIEINPERTDEPIKSAYRNLNAYFDLAICYLQQDKIEEAEEMFKKAYETTDYYSPTTVKYYLRLYTILEERSIRLVAMQYPMRSIDKLKRMFNEEQQKNIIFVSNEENFKKALENASYEDLFVDRFAGDFGHATLKGNMLIAENVADAILGELG